MKRLRERLVADFADAEYAHAYMESHAVTHIASQVHLMRKDRGWTQRQLADRAGITQEQVSKIENGDFTSLTMKTLQKFSRAFDVNLEVTFGTFSRAILDLSHFVAERLVITARGEDLALFAKTQTTTTGNVTVLALPMAPPSIVAAAPRADVVGVLPSDLWMRLGPTPVTARRVTQ